MTSIRKRDFSLWEFNHGYDGPGLNFLKEYANNIANDVMDNVDENITISMNPYFDFDGKYEPEDGLIVSISYSEYDPLQVQITLCDLAVDCSCGDKRLARFIASDLRKVADHLDDKFRG